MAKRTGVIFLLGLMCGLAIMGVLSWQKQPWQAEAAVQAASDKVQEETNTAALPAMATSVQDVKAAASAIADWYKETVYVGGDEAVYNGKVYRAKWWTQGETPGNADVWEDTLVAEAEKLPAPVVTTPVPTAAKQTDFKVVGYVPSWKEDIGKLRFDILTHVNYAFAIPTAEGGLRPLENAALAQQLIQKAHAADCKVLLAVGGWSYQDTPLEATFMQATATAEKRAAFADAIVTMCDQYGFDGVDMDWEHPRVDGTSAAQYEALMLDLSTRLHKKGKLLSAAVLSGATADGNIYYDAAAHSDKVLAAVDYINVMAYDGGDGERHSSYEFAVNCGTYWQQSRGLSADKVVLGVPFYARPSWAAYGDILSLVPNAWQSDHVTYQGMDVWYNGCATIEKKTNYAMKNLGGVMIWEVTQDAAGEHSLLSTIGQTIAKK